MTACLGDVQLSGESLRVRHNGIGEEKTRQDYDEDRAGALMEGV